MDGRKISTAVCLVCFSTLEARRELIPNTRAVRTPTRWQTNRPHARYILHFHSLAQTRINSSSTLSNVSRSFVKLQRISRHFAAVKTRQKLMSWNWSLYSRWKTGARVITMMTQWLIQWSLRKPPNKPRLKTRKIAQILTDLRFYQSTNKIKYLSN